MKRTTRSFASAATCRLIAMQQQKQRAIEVQIKANTRKAFDQELRAPACLICDNKNSEACNGCDA